MEGMPIQPSFMNGTRPLKDSASVSSSYLTCATEFPKYGEESLPPYHSFPLCKKKTGQFWLSPSPKRSLCSVFYLNLSSPGSKEPWLVRWRKTVTNQVRKVFTKVHFAV